MVPRLPIAVAWAAGLCALAAPLHADDLKNQTFELQYGPSGITSLRRAHDVADTEYVGPNGGLGRLIVRYRTAPHGDWKELRDLLLSSVAGSGNSIVFTLGTVQPSLASRASGSAV
ncbi:MAG TPA: hypothetical protein VFZ98_12350, partial [Vicinamibacterales bacterium]